MKNLFQETALTAYKRHGVPYDLFREILSLLSLQILTLSQIYSITKISIAHDDNRILDSQAIGPTRAEK